MKVTALSTAVSRPTAMLIGASVATRASSAIRYSGLRSSPGVNRSRRSPVVDQPAGQQVLG